MGNVVFVVGAFLFFGLGALIVYWMFDFWKEKDGWRDIICEYIMAALLLLYHIYGSPVFGIIPQYGVVFCASIILSIFLCLHITIYIFEDYSKIKLLLLLSLLTLELWQIVTVWSNVKENINYIEHVLLIFMSLITTLGVEYILTLTKGGKKRRSELFQTRYYRSNSDLPFDFYVHNSGLSGKVSDSINYLVIKLYQYAKEEKLTPSRLAKFLKHYDDIVPSSVQNKVINRFMDSHYLNQMESVNLIEFAAILFPEFFGSPRKAYSSEGYNLRLFEEFYMLSQKNLDRSQTQLRDLNLKLNKIEELLTGTVGSHNSDAVQNEKPKNISFVEDSNQLIVREIFHLTKTPLLTINVAIKNLLNNNEDHLTATQKEKLSTIMDNASTVKLIIEAYRRLVTVSDVSTNEDIVSYIKTAVSSICDVCKKQIKQEISEFPEKISVHGNNVIIILMMPLIHNAIEASPDNANLVIKCIEEEDKYKITVENTCIVTPKKKDLNTDGYSSKTDGGEGLRSVRRISKSIGIEFRINTYNRDKKVIAMLIIPKR